jgi:UDP-N-acetylmuramoyl-L-alanyl-D-glutamate--2,6-diaminopimelate ligase
MHICGQMGEVELPVFGDFNLENVMCAAGLAASKGLAAHAIFAALANISRPPARLELIESNAHAPMVFIDFAHTPDALQKVLETIRTFSKGSLRVVFGCGGDRDKQKRPLMGAIAASIADDVWITSDNPRHEDPGQILEDIRAGIEPFLISKCKIIPDRAKAIHEAIKSAHSDDIVLIAGKGHETTQQIGDVYLPFSDRSVAIKALEVWQE